MYAVVKFNEAEDAINFKQAIAAFAGWELKLPLNSNIKGCVRVLNIGGTENDKALYKYLRGLAAFEEVTLE